jgi:hypothetical protein
MRMTGCSPPPPGSPPIWIDDDKPDVAEHPATTSDDEAGDTEPEEHSDLAYASTKAMGDADHEVICI